MAQDTPSVIKIAPHLFSRPVIAQNPSKIEATVNSQDASQKILPVTLPVARFGVRLVSLALRRESLLLLSK
jgi:hypothetical protein